MTTVVFDGKYLVADTAVTRIVTPFHNKFAKNVENDSTVKAVYGHRSKIKTVPAEDNVMFKGERVLAMGSAGSVSAAEFVETLILESVDFSKVGRSLNTYLSKTPIGKDNDCTILVITAQNAWLVHSERMRVQKVTQFPVAIGSGSKVALFSMKLGANIFQSVAMACFDDYGSKSPFDYLVLESDDIPLKIKTVTYSDITKKFESSRQGFAELIDKTLGQMESRPYTRHGFTLDE